MRKGSVSILKQLFSTKQEVFGLDVGSSCVKIVQLDKDDVGYVVSAAARTDIMHAAPGDEEQEMRNTVAAIRTCLKSAHMRTKYAVCGICGPDVAVRSFSFPTLSNVETDHAVFAEADQVCPFETDQSVIDYQLLSRPETITAQGSANASALGITSGILAAATDETIVRRRQLVKEASLHCVFMDVDGLALLNWFLANEELQPHRAVAILDIGNSFANLVIIKSDGLPFIRDIPYAGHAIVHHMAVAQRLAPQVVRDILAGQLGTSAQPRNGDANLKQACEKLIVSISQTLRYYITQEAVRVEKMYICGGLGQAQGILEMLANELPCAITAWNPFEKIRCAPEAPGADLLRNHGPAMAIAAGLAMRTI